MKKDGIEPAMTYKDGRGYNCCIVKTNLSTNLHSQLFAEKLNNRYGLKEEITNYAYFPADLSAVKAAQDVKTYSKSALTAIIEKNDYKFPEQKLEAKAQAVDEITKDDHPLHQAQSKTISLEKALEAHEPYLDKTVTQSLNQKKEIIHEETKEQEQTHEIGGGIVGLILQKLVQMLKALINTIVSAVTQQKTALFAEKDKNIEQNKGKTQEKELSPEQKIEKLLEGKQVAKTIDEIPPAPALSVYAETAPELEPKNPVQEKAVEKEQVKQAELAKEREIKAQAKEQQKTQSPKRKKSHDLTL